MSWTTTRRVRCAPDRAWDLLVDTAAWPAWGPTVRAVDTPTRRLTAGTRGRISPAPGVWLPFAVTEWDEGRRWAWRVAGIPATGHEVRPVAAGGDTCDVTFTVPTWAPTYLLVCRAALTRIEALAAA